MSGYTRRFSTKRKVIAIILLTAVIIGWLSWQYRPLMLDTALKVARNKANEVINRTVYELLSQKEGLYDELIELSYNTDGNVTALKANAANINALKSQTAMTVREALAQEGVQNIGIPLGTLCASTVLSGRGPTIPCKALMSSVPNISLQFHFDGAGINQTLHSIVMKVTVPLSVTLPLQDGETEVVTTFLVGETILVGMVPDSYTNVISDPEVADDIFNYGDAG